MTTTKIVDYQRKVVKFAKQWGIDPIKVGPVSNDDGFTFMSSKSGNIYYTNPDKGILFNTENLGGIYNWSDIPTAFIRKLAASRERSVDQNLMHMF